MLMHEVFHVSLLRPCHRRKGRDDGTQTPPAYLPTGDIEEEVAEIVSHDTDADNE